MPERCETVVIGGGQAGLAASYFLTQRGCEHVVLEQGRVGETWRSKRWDGFAINTPNWSMQLPGHPYQGPDPDGFCSAPDVVAYLEAFAGSFGAPVQEGVRVSALRRENGQYVLDANGEPLRARTVVVSTGAFQRPAPSPLARHVPGDVFQLHAEDYRHPQQLPEGAVLIVGSGQSGCQIANELLGAGRTVVMSVGRCPWAPRRYRGREILHWLIEIGMMDDTVDTLPSPAARLKCNPPISGKDGGHDCHPRWLARHGARLVGRLEGIRGHVLQLATDAEETLAQGDEFVATLKTRIDEHVRAAGLDVPAAEATEHDDPPVAPLEQLDLREAAIRTILWANGYRPDFDWIDLPLCDAEGWPAHERGVTAFLGLYFVGLHWLYKRRSALFMGVGEDAEHAVSHLVRRETSLGIP